MSAGLTQGVLERIARGEKVHGPILQVTDIRKTQTPANSGSGHADKFRLTLSDGTHTFLAYVATQSTKPLLDGQVQKYHIIRLQEYCVTEFSNMTFIIIARFEPIQAYQSLIGNPVPLNNTASRGTAAPAAPAPAAAAAPTPAAPAAAPAPMRVPPSPLKSTNTVIASRTSQAQPVYTDATAGAGAAAAAGGAATAGGTMLVPIKTLHPYQGAWTIRARVTSKTPMKEFTRKTGGGTGKLFSVNLIDEAGDEIRATAFSEVAEKLFNVLEEGHVYIISKGQIKVANQKFTTVKHPYEITLNDTTTVQPVADDASTASIPAAHFALVPISQIAGMNKDEMVDVLGVVTEASDPQTLVQKSTGRELTKRTLTLLDTSGYTIEVTLWGDRALQEGVAVGAIVAVRAARVGTFNTKSLSTTASSQVVVAPSIPEAAQLAAWYRDKGSAAVAQATAISVPGDGGSTGTRDDSIKSLATVLSEQLGQDSQKKDYFTCVACITAIRHSGKISYTACSDPKCPGKVTLDTTGQYYCSKCNRSMPQASERYMLHMHIADETASIWVTCFNETSLRIMDNRPASELVQLQERSSEEYEAAFNDAAHRWYQFRCSARTEQYREEMRTQYSVVSATPVDFSKECQRLLAIIDSYSQP